MRLHAGIRFILRVYGHARETHFQVLNELFHHHILAVLAAIGVIRHSHHKGVYLVDFHQFVETYEQIRRLLVNRFSRKSHTEFGIGKRDPDAVFTIIKRKVVHELNIVNRNPKRILKRVT